MTTPPPEPGARPRVEGEREQEILDATLVVLAEVGYDRLTMDAVAAQARASKATLYRRWERKSTLVLEALLAIKEPPRTTVLDTGSLRGDLIALHCGHAGLTDPHVMAVFNSILTALGRDEQFATEFRDRFLGPKIAHAQAAYRRAAERGEVRDDIDLDLVIPALAAIILHRQFVLGLPADANTVTAVIDQIILPSVTPVSQIGTTHP